MHCTIHELSLIDSPRTDGVCLFPARRPTPLRVDRKRALPQRAGKCCPIGREDPFTGRTPERVTPCNPSSGGIGGMHDAEHFGRRNIERSDMIAQGTGPIPAAGVPSASPAPEGGCKRSDSGAKGGGDTASISHTAAALTHSGLLDDLFGFEPADTHSERSNSIPGAFSRNSTAISDPFSGKRASASTRRSSWDTHPTAASW